MPLLPKGYTGASIGDAPISAGRRATAQDFGAPGLGESGLVEAGHRVTATAKAELASIEEQEARKALVDSTEVRAEFARRLDEAALSGADTGKLKAEMAARLAKIGEAFATKRGMDQLRQYSANAEVMFDQQASQINVVRASVQAKSDGQRLVNALAAEIDRDPSALPQQVAAMEEFLQQFPGISPETRTRLADTWRNDLNFKAAVRSMRDAPKAALERLEKGQWDVTPEQREILTGRARTEIEGQRRDRELARLEAHRAESDAVDLARSKYIDAIIAGKASWPAMRDDPAFAGPQGANAKKELFLFMDARKRQLEGGERKGSKSKEVELFLRYASGEITSKQHIVDAVRDHAEGRPGLDLTQARQMINEAQRARDAKGQTLLAREGQLVREFGDAASRNVMIQGLAAADPNLIPTLQMTYRNAVNQKINELFEQDKSPNLVFDPKSEHYVGPGPFTQEMFNRVLKAETRAHVDAATAAGAVDLRLEPDGWKKLKPGDVAIMPDGTTGRVTAATIAILKKQGLGAVEFPFTPSGETPNAQDRRAAAERAAKYRDALGIR